MIFGSFRSFQNFEPKILKKIQVTLITSNNQTMHFFHGLLIFLSQPTCGILRKITKSLENGLVRSVEVIKVKMSKIAKGAQDPGLRISKV